MPPQIKQDLNRSGWESTDFPSVCETCLPENPYVKMLKEDYGAECKLVSCRCDHSQKQYIRRLTPVDSAHDLLQYFHGAHPERRRSKRPTSA